MAAAAIVVVGVALRLWLTPWQIGAVPTQPVAYGWLDGPTLVRAAGLGGALLAALTLLLDGAKGWLAPTLVDYFDGSAPGPVLAAAIGALLGHCFPVWLGFKGGKGVATTLGVMWGLSWPVGAIACGVWLLVAAAFRWSSLAALVAVVAAAIAAWFLTDHRAALLLTLLVPLVWVRHHENIARLLKGTEPKIGQRTKG